MSWMDWVLLALVALCGVLALRSARRARKNGKCAGCSGCGGSCGDCTGKKESKPPAKPEVWSGPIRAYYGRSPLRGPKGLPTAFLSRATP